MIVSTAFMLGAVMIEKHFTLNKTLTGNDHYHAMDPSRKVGRVLLGVNPLKITFGGKGEVCLSDNRS